MGPAVTPPLDDTQTTEIWRDPSRQARRVTFRVHADRTAFCGLTGERIVEPGEIRVGVGGASDRLPLRGSFTLTGPGWVAGPDRVLDTPVLVTDP
jgi:beta-xylosidase